MPNCIQCKNAFEIVPAEAEFLKKISMVDPRVCPLCRRQWRFAWRNERRLYHRKCDLTGKQIISIYAPDSPYKVYDQHEWHSDKWDGLQYGRDFDFNRPFFDQFKELMLATPKISVFATNNENSDYANGAQRDKNCYMIFVSDHNQDCYYSYAIDSCSDCTECINCYKCTLCIECVDCSDSYNLAYCEKTHTSRDSWFLYDCKNCQDCFGCFGLRGKQYCIFNEQYTKEQYKEKLKEFNVGSAAGVAQLQQLVAEKRKNKQIQQYMDGNNNVNSTGDHLVNCKNCFECYDSGKLEDCGYLLFSFNSKDCFDGHVVVENSQLCYGTISTINQYNVQFAFVSFYSKNSMYLDHAPYVQDCFGCSGLKRQQYCILNKKYSKEEYEALRLKIIEHMKKTGEWGIPLPPQLSPFGYNETIAQEYFPLSKETATARGWKWRDENLDEVAVYQGPKTETPDDIKDVKDDIVFAVLACEKCSKPYKIIPQELKLYKTHGVPLPRMCFDDRHVNRIGRRNPRQLWQRPCQKCGKELQSSYAPDRPDPATPLSEGSRSGGKTIYCEECYLQSVY